MIHKHDKAIGITTWRWNYFRIVLWYMPPKFNVEKHMHTDFSGELMLLVASIWVRKIKDGIMQEADNLFRWYSVPVGCIHWADSKGSSWIPTIFINKESWNKKPTSAAANFIQ